jgi:hypothetical protein
VLGIRRRVGERPLDPGFDDAVAAHVDRAHLGGGGLGARARVRRGWVLLLLCVLCGQKGGK